MPDYTIHVVSHTHWDREWYMPFERHRRRLVQLIDSLLDAFDHDPDFKHFHLDGQSIILEDYLEIRPENEDRLRAAIAAGKLAVGPWYVQADEFLVSGEATVRNLMHGLRVAARFGDPLMVGYLPDAFGHISQMPQILEGFGIDTAVFGRGINRRDDDAEAADAQGYKSELLWEAPDGSEILAIFLANWYNNAMAIPTSPAEAVDFVRKARDASSKYATTSHLLLMNGADHIPVQLDVPQAIKAADAGLSDDRVIHSSIAAHIEGVEAEVDRLQTKTGEMRHEHSDGWRTLANTLSSRLHQKRANWRCQTRLEKWAEPFGAFAWLLGGADESGPLRHAWRLLLQNHPHDSICGCSTDAVHREMDVRFLKCEQLADQIALDACKAIADDVDTSAAPEDAAPVVVFNPLNVAREEMVVAQVDFPEDEEFEDLIVEDPEGNEVRSHVEEDLGVVWDYELPDDAFRRGSKRRRARVAFIASVPACGYALYYVIPAELDEEWSEEDELKRIQGMRVFENESLLVEIAPDGTLGIEQIAGPPGFSDLHLFQDGTDVGDAYVYRAPEGDESLTPDPTMVEIEPTSANEVYIRYEVYHTIDLPRYLHRHVRRRGGPLALTSRLTLVRGVPRLDVQTVFENTHNNHRLRVLLPTDIDAEHASADGQFDIVKRRIVPHSSWTNPSNCQPQQAFVDVSGESHGLTIANRGLPEYEVLRDERNSIALTLLRSTGEIGDWGDFPTPGGQCRGWHTTEYSIIPHGGALEDSDAHIEARKFNAPLEAVQTGVHEGRLPPSVSFLSVTPERLVLSAVKKCERGDGLIVRAYNPFDTPVHGVVQ
ncbi:MAG: alpha-mannosidase, partial [Armatimonadota bacterium]